MFKMHNKKELKSLLRQSLFSTAASELGESVFSVPIHPCHAGKILVLISSNGFYLLWFLRINIPIREIVIKYLSDIKVYRVKVF